MTSVRKSRLTGELTPKQTPKDEAQFQLDVIELAHHYKWKVAHFKAAMLPSGAWGTPVQADGEGFPDLVLVRGKIIMFVELKSLRGDLRKEQVDWMCALGPGNKHVYCWGPQDWDFINSILEDTR